MVRWLSADYERSAIRGNERVIVCERRIQRGRERERVVARFASLYVAWNGV